jgi:hypothetical protein
MQSGRIARSIPGWTSSQKRILHSIPEHCQWIVDFGLATSLYLRTEEVAKLTWSQVVLGTKKHIVGLIGRRTFHITNIFDKTHKLSLQNPTAQRDLRETKYDAVEDINNPNCFVKAIHELHGNCSPLQKRFFTLKTRKKEKNRLHAQGLKSYYFDPRSSRAIGIKSVSAFLDELSEICVF